MTLEDRTAVVKAVELRFNNLLIAMAINAAIEVASKRWTAEDTKIYGTKVAHLLTEED
jgi:hypothetical protein